MSLIGKLHRVVHSVRVLKVMLAAVATTAIVATATTWLYLRQAARPQVEGEMRLASLSEPVEVLRDALGVPYILARNTPDLLRAQGFVTAQHRLMQMELFRTTIRGELAELLGEAALQSDIRMRVLGVARNGQRHAQQLSAASRAFFQHYVDGINAYVEGHSAEHPVELRLLGLRARPWSVADLVTLVHFVHYTHATNLKAELLGQMLVDAVGPERAAELQPELAHPEAARALREVLAAADTPMPAPHAPRATEAQVLGLRWEDLLFKPEVAAHQGLGSNNWAIAPARAANGRAMLANDPHLDNRLLPGTFHPVGLFAPGVRAVGGAIPGLPGILLGRSGDVAFGITNAYGDVQDVYIERLDPQDPQRYLDGELSLPFEVEEQRIRIKDDSVAGGVREHLLQIRRTRRGPVISDHKGLGPEGDRVLVLRSTAAEVHAPQTGLEGLLTARSADALDRELQKFDLMLFNVVYADAQGHIGHRATGALPLRSGPDGSLPRPVPADGEDDWRGFVTKQQNPGMRDPVRGWVGTANHDVRPPDYPWYYTNYVAPDYRYRRMAQVLDAAQAMDVDAHWALMEDSRNLQSDVLRPLLVDVLRQVPEQADLAALLAQWDGVDRADSAAPLIYQALYREVALGTFSDELGETLAPEVLSTWYFWQQRFDALLADPDNAWFDDVRTPQRETLEDVIRAAAPRARALLVSLQGEDPSRWRWGSAHTLSFASPLRRSGLGSGLAGGFTVERSGGGETLNRGVYAFNEPFAVNFFASMRLVVDFADDEKIEAVLAGGINERHLQPQQNAQARIWAAGERRPWWFSEQAVREHAVSRMLLLP